MKRRRGRQAAIREIVREKPIRTQRELVEELSKRGYTCTQATVSRDIASMGLTKPEGVYVLAEDLLLQQTLSEYVTEVANTDQLVVLHCQTGWAANVASAIDQACLPFALGSIAGSDTVFVAMSSAEGASSLRQLIENLK